MSLELQELRDKIKSARNLLGVVETMRGLAAVNIRRAEAVAARSAAYARTVHLALHAALSAMEGRSGRDGEAEARVEGAAGRVYERAARPGAARIARRGLGAAALRTPARTATTGASGLAAAAGGPSRTAAAGTLGRTAAAGTPGREPAPRSAGWTGDTVALLITTDMGLCGQFNERIAGYALALMRRHPETTFRWVVVGMRGWERLRDAEAETVELLNAPGSVEAVGNAVAEAFVALSRHYAGDGGGRLLVVHNRQDDRHIFAPTHRQLAPFEPERWLTWPEDEGPWRTPPQTSPPPEQMLPFLLREQLHIDLFQAFIQSFAAENAARLSSMRNATDNIEELLAELEASYRRERQDVITNELMELLGGVEAVTAHERADRGSAF